MLEDSQHGKNTDNFVETNNYSLIKDSLGGLKKNCTNNGVVILHEELLYSMLTWLWLRFHPL